MDGGLVAVLVAGVTAVGGIVGIVIQQGGATRDRVDALRKDLGVRIDGLQAELNALKRDLALLAQRVDAVSARVDELPAQPVDETECRERHEQLQSDLLLAGNARRLIVTGSGGGSE
jgi:hypothetical protein